MADGHDKIDEVVVVAEGESSAETFHEIESEEVCPTKMCLLLKVTQSWPTSPPNRSDHREVSYGPC